MIHARLNYGHNRPTSVQCVMPVTFWKATGPERSHGHARCTLPEENHQGIRYQMATQASPSVKPHAGAGRMPVPQCRHRRLHFHRRRQNLCPNSSR